MSREAQDIEGKLRNIAQFMPSEEMLDLQLRTESVIDALGKKVPTDAPDELWVETPLLHTDLINGKDFEFRLRRTTHLDPTKENEQYSVIQLIARGTDENDVVCANLEKAIVSVPATEGLPPINEDSDVALFDTVVRAGQEIVREQEEAAAKKYEVTRRNFLWGCAATAGILAAGGTVKLLAGVDWSEINPSEEQRFDRKGYTLSGGSLLTLGQTVTPEFSQELAYNPELAGDLIPILTNVMHGHDYYPDDDLNIGDGLRQIIIPNGMHREKPQGSEIPWTYVVPLHSVPSSAKIHVWTDLRASNGRSRADELRLTFHNDQLIYEWHGYPVNHEKARIVVKIEQ